MSSDIEPTTDHDIDRHGRPLARRRILLGSATAAAAAVLSACGRIVAGSSGGFGTRTVVASGTQLTPASAVPVGGGTILDTEKTVVTQPVKGTYKAFSAVCTHAGCLVTSIESGEIICPCHGSHFSIADGSVISGPASSALPATKVKRSGSMIVSV